MASPEVDKRHGHDLVICGLTGCPEYVMPGRTLAHGAALKKPPSSVRCCDKVCDNPSHTAGHTCNEFCPEYTILGNDIHS